MKTRISWLDVKLGIRMLLKHPALTVVGGLGMAVAIAVSAGAFAFFYGHLYPRLDLPNGDRLVGLENWDVEQNNESRQSLHDFVVWREQLRGVQHVAAFRTLSRNLMVPGQAVRQVQVAEMTAAGFPAAGVAPLMGRTFTAEEERPGAPPVLVIGYRAWRDQFGGDPRILGRTVRMGGTVHTIIGVMPERYAFPVSHAYWRPLRVSIADFRRGSGPELFVFGSLAPGVTRARAQAELDALGRRAAAAYPETNSRLRPQVLPYTYPIADIQDVALWQVSLMQLAISLLVLVVAINVAVLMYARTAARRGEIAVRTALGASRSRIVAQLFAEALVLSAAAAVVGLGLARFGLSMVNRMMEAEYSGRPFWMDYSIPRATLVWVVGLALLTAVVVGVVPALQVTGRRLQVSLRESGTGTTRGMGRAWTVMIIGQVALAVAGIPVAVFMVWSQVEEAASRPKFAAEEFVAAGLSMDYDLPPGTEPEAYDQAYGERYVALTEQVIRRVQAEPEVLGVALTSGYPGFDPPASIEVEGMPSPVETGAHPVRYDRVGTDFFEVFGVPVLTGRSLQSQDAREGSVAVMVNRSFARDVLRGAPALGRRFRYVDGGPAGAPAPAAEAPARWFEVVGVVEDLYDRPAGGPDAARATIYHPLVPGNAGAMLIVRVRSTARAAFGGRLERVAAEVDPALRVVGVRTVASVSEQKKVATRLLALVFGLVTLSVLLLSAAGIYAMMSFTVASRRREIGIRSALGAHPRRLLAAIFSRAFGQLGAGLLAGAALGAVLDVLSDGELIGGRSPVLLPLVSLVMLVTGLLAAIGPARRGLRIEPTEALRSES